MKINRLLNYALLMGLFVTLSDCKKDDPEADLITPSDTKKLSAAIVMPGGTTSVEGTMPASTNTAQSPKITSGVTEYPVINGSTENISFNYTNLSGGIGGAYSQIEGSDSYFNIPLASPNAGNYGSISLPIGMPENIASGDFTMIISIYDASGRISNTLRIRFNISRIMQAGVGKGNVTYNGKTITGDAICDINKLVDLGMEDSFLDASAFVTESGDVVIIYNVTNEGTTKLVNANNENLDLSRQPWLYYLSSSDFRLMVSTGGTVVRNGNSIIFNATLQEFYENTANQSISGSVRCQ